jgi:small-conductance mechanosensitive channel
VTLVALLVTLLISMGAGALTWLSCWLARRMLGRHPVVDDVVRRVGRAAVALVASIAAATSFGEHGAPVGQHLAILMAIASAAWVVIAASGGLGGAMVGRLDLDVTDNRRARSMHTQLQVVRRVIVVVAVLVAAAAAMLTFPSGRALGSGLLASAGVAGLVAGIAGRSTLGNLVAGIQIAFAAPVRLDDVVVVEGEWGWIEEITLTNVVVRIWDQRRLVLPSSYFVEQPFENWTRTRSEIIGEVLLQVDHRAPLADLRRVLELTCRDNPLWDGRVCQLQVVDAGPSSITVRALVSARNAPTAWDLRCMVREALITWMATEHPAALPRVRTDAPEEAPDASPAGQTPALIARR